MLLLIYCLMYFPLFAGVLIYFPLFVGVMCFSLFCYALRCVRSCFAIIFKRNRKLVALLNYCLTDIWLL